MKLHLASIRMCFDWLVTGGVLTTKPAHAVRGPKHVVKRGKTPVLTSDQARALIESIDTSTLVGLRDRALIGVMTYAFARIGAAVAMRVEDYFANGKRWWVRLHEKGGKRHEMPAHHKLEAFLDEYIKAAGIGEQAKSPSSAPPLAAPASEALHRIDAYRMIQCCAAELGLKVKIGCHTFRATGITDYLEAGETLENAQMMAAHESPRTTKLCEPELVRKTFTPRAPKPKPMRIQKVASQLRPTISAAIVEVLNARGALPAAEIAEQIQAGGREIGKRSISHSLQAFKKQGRVRIRGEKWMLLKARSKAASARQRKE